MNRLPKYNFVGPHTDPALTANAEAYLEHHVIELPPELDKTPERRAQFLAMQECVIAYGHDLGVDLSRRTTPQHRFHIMDESGMEALYDRFPHQRGSLAITLTTGDIVVQELPSELLDATLQNTQHELLHNFANTDIELIPTGEGWLTFEPRSGLAFKQGSFWGINEYWTERTNQKIVRTYWPRHPLLNPFTGSTNTLHRTNSADLPPEMSYDSLLEFGNKWEAYVRTALGERVIEQLELSVLTGDSNALRHIDARLGNHVRELARLQTHLPRHVGETAARLNIVMQG